MLNRKGAAFLLTLAICFSGCTDLSYRGMPGNEATVLSNEETEEWLAVTSAEEQYKTYSFEESDEAFLANTIFIGDATAQALQGFGLTSDVSLADAHLGAYNILTERFIDTQQNREYALLTELVNLQPENIVISLGRNDLLQNNDTFVQSYTTLLDTIHTYCPAAALYVLSIPPVTHKASITLAKIAEANATLKDSIAALAHVKWIDISAELQNSAGYLKSNYAGNDGITLEKAGVSAVLWQICKTAKQ